MSNIDERAEFEKWCLTDDSSADITRLNVNSYQCGWTASQWLGWQARARVGKGDDMYTNSPVSIPIQETCIQSEQTKPVEFKISDYDALEEAICKAALERKAGSVTYIEAKPVEVGELASDIRKACAVPAINYAMKDGAIDWEAMANGQATAAAQAILNKYNVTEK